MITIPKEVLFNLPDLTIGTEESHLGSIWYGNYMNYRGANVDIGKSENSWTVQLVICWPYNFASYQSFGFTNISIFNFVDGDRDFSKYS